MALELELKHASPLKTKISEQFPDQQIISSNGHSGSELITILFTSYIILKQGIALYIKYKETITKAHIIYEDGKTGNKIEISGLSKKELQEFIDSENIEKLKTKVNDKKRRN